MPKRYPHEEYDENTDIRALVPKTPEIIRDKGRPQLNEAALVALETALKLDCPIDEACVIAGIWRSTYYKYWKQYAWFRARMQKAMDYPKVLARASVQNQIAKWDWKLALKYLQLRDKRMWAMPVVEEDENEQAPIVQFISVAANKWDPTNDLKSSWQMSIEQKSASDTSVTILENNNESDMIRENEQEISERLNSLSSNNG